MLVTHQMENNIQPMRSFQYREMEYCWNKSIEIAKKEFLERLNVKYTSGRERLLNRYFDEKDVMRRLKTNNVGLAHILMSCYATIALEEDLKFI